MEHSIWQITFPPVNLSKERPSTGTENFFLDTESRRHKKFFVYNQNFTENNIREGYWKGIGWETTFYSNIGRFFQRLCCLQWQENFWGETNDSLDLWDMFQKIWSPSRNVFRQISHAGPIQIKWKTIIIIFKPIIS